MEESILISTKKVLGVGPDDDSFDLDIVTHINSVFFNLQQLGLGPSGGFVIEDEEAQWDDFETDFGIIAQVKTFVYLKVRMLFDPPQTSYLIAAFEKQIAEHEWRLNVQREETDWSEPVWDPLTIDGGDAD
jgi:hypothetical protein